MTYHKNLSDLIVSEFEDFFKSRFDDNLVYDPDATFNFDGCFSSRILIKGENVKGYLFINTTEEALRHSHPERKYGDVISDEDLMDWVGEIVNRALGNMKNTLHVFNIETQLNPPTCQRTPFTIANDISAPVQTWFFTNKKFQVAVSLQLELNQNVNFNKSA